jgi:hypothetical protein
MALSVVRLLYLFPALDPKLKEPPHPPKRFNTYMDWSTCTFINGQINGEYKTDMYRGGVFACSNSVMFINGMCHHTNKEKASIKESKKHMDENTCLKAYMLAPLLLV